MNIRLLHIFLVCLFTLGAKHTIASQKDSVTVYLFLAEDCKICQYYTPLLNELHQHFQNDRIGFIGLFPNRYSTEDGIEAFRNKYKITFQLKKEYFQTKTQSFGATITPEVVVFNETREEVIYQGRIDDSYYALGKRRRVVKNHELKEVLNKISNGEQLEIENQPAIGCYIMLK